MSIYAQEINDLMLVHKKTRCDNLLLVTDHHYEELIKDGIHIIIKPVYEWCAELFSNIQ